VEISKFPEDVAPAGALWRSAHTYMGSARFPWPAKQELALKTHLEKQSHYSAQTAVRPDAARGAGSAKMTMIASPDRIRASQLRNTTMTSSAHQFRVKLTELPTESVSFEP